MRFSASVYFLAAYLSVAALAHAQQAPAATPASPAPASTPMTPSPPAGAPGVASGGAAPAGSQSGAAPAMAAPNGAQGAAADAVPAAAPTVPAQPGAPGAPAPGTVAEPQAQPGAPVAVAPAQGRAPVTPAHDSERPPADPVPEEPSYTGFSARLAFGVGGGLWLADGDAKLFRPLFLVLDLGYAVTRNLTIIARGSTWLPTDDLANEFVGAGAVYRFLAERLYVAGALGVSLTRFGAASEWQHFVQGLALEADVGQVFALTTHTSFSVGAHFQFGSPFLGKAPDAFTSLHAGIFVAFGFR